MKRLLYILIILLSVPLTVKSQTTDDILNLLVQQNLLTPALADSIRAEAAIKNQDAEAKKKVFGVTSGRTIVLGGYTQVRYQNLDEPGKINGFDVRRAGWMLAELFIQAGVTGIPLVPALSVRGLELN